MKKVIDLYNRIKEKRMKINEEFKLKDNSKEIMELKFILQSNMWI